MPVDNTVGAPWRLTRREAEVLALVAQRWNNAEIAAELVISKRTVESHVSALLAKTEARDRGRLAAAGRRLLGTASAAPPAASPGYGPERFGAVRRQARVTRARSAWLRGQAQQRVGRCAAALHEAGSLTARAAALRAEAAAAARVIAR